MKLRIGCRYMRPRPPGTLAIISSNPATQGAPRVWNRWCSDARVLQTDLRRTLVGARYRIKNINCGPFALPSTWPKSWLSDLAYNFVRGRPYRETVLVSFLWTKEGQRIWSEAFIPHPNPSLHPISRDIFSSYLFLLPFLIISLPHLVSRGYRVDYYAAEVRGPRSCRREGVSFLS